MQRKRRTLTLALVVLLSTTAPVLGTSPSAEFDAGTVETTAGETAEIPVGLSNTDTATVTIGSEAVNYVATVVVRDGNGDRNVTLQYDTSNAGHGGAFSVTVEADTVTVENETDLDDDHLLTVGIYDLAVAPGNASDANATDVSRLVVTRPPESDSEPETETTTPGPYAGHVADIEDGVVVARAKNQTITGTVDLTPGTVIQVLARGDTFVQSETATVTDGGRFRASFDFEGLPSDVENGTEFTLRVRANGESQKEVTGVFRTPPTNRETAETTKRAVQDETTESTTHTEDVPGFGLSTGVLALAAVALLALRRGE
ncbi:BGTF surface domain-containing protein [Halorussus salinisoli]|uniref:BGTF surface domain-containing protein n=1 Tax=Halorussus salinisoli TaxID=2558242 RepID=UPI0010C1DB9A|nr:BGTF surface domain-containing protein [Halorussus salinisoli]